MSIFSFNMHRGANTSRKTRKNAFTAAQRLKQVRRQVTLENLEERCLLSFYNPRPVGLVAPDSSPVVPVEGVAIPTGTTLGEFASSSPPANLTATVSINGDAGPFVSATVVRDGSELVPPGPTSTPDYLVEAPAGLIPPDETPGLQIEIRLNDSSVGANTVIFNTPSVADAPLSVSSTPASIPATEGVPLGPTQLLSFSDANTLATTADYTVTVDWGDGTPVQTLPASDIVQSDGLGTPFLVTADHTYAEKTPGATPDVITVTVNDDGGSKLVAQTVADVAEQTLTDDTPGLTPITTTVNSPLTNVVVAEFTDPNPLATPSDFTAAITSWGDGTPPVGNPDPGTIIELGVDAGGAHFAVEGSHTYAVPVSGGAITTLITDIGGGFPGSILPDPILPVTVDPSGIQIAAAPVVVPEGPIIPAGTVIGTFTDQSFNPASPPTYTATVTFLGATAPTTLDVNAVAGPNGNTFELTTSTDTSFTDPAGIDEGVTNYTVDVTSSADTITPAAETVGQLTVTDAPLTADATVALPVTATEGTTTGAVPLFNFDDANPVATTADFTATIDWGDGSPNSTGTITEAGSVFTVSGAHVYAEPGAGPYTITVTVKDDGGSTITGTNTATVADALLGPGGPASIPFNAAEGQLLTNIPLGTFSDFNPDATSSDFLGLINWGDGSPTDLATFTRVSGTSGRSIWLVTGNHTYTSAAGSPFTVTVHVTDVDGSVLALATPTGDITTTATVTQSALQVEVVEQNPSAGVPIPPSTPITPLGLLTDVNGLDPIGDYTVVINWGDGSPTDTTSGFVGADPALGLNTNDQLAIFTTGGHVYAKPGLYPISIGIADGDPVVGLGNGFALVAPAVVTLTPLPVGAPIAAVEGNPLPSPTDVATFTSSNPGALTTDFTATIDWGDGSPQSAGIITQPGGVGTPFIVSGNHTYAEANAAGYTITVLVTDNTSDTTQSTTTTAVVADALLGPGGPASIPFNATEGQLLTNIPLGTFSDFNPNATSSDFLGLINWGDGSPTDLATFTRVSGTTGRSIWLVTGSHTYTSPAGSPFTVTVHVTDTDGSVLTLATPTGDITTTATVIQTPLAVQGTSINGVAGSPTIPGGFAIAEFSDNAGADPIGDYSATIFWGDTLSDPATIIPGPNGNSFLVIAPLGGHTYATPGLYPITIIVHDADAVDGTANTFALIAPAVVTLTPLPVGAPIAAVEGNPLPSPTDVATFTSSNLGALTTDFTATIDWGDGSPQSAGIITQPGGVGTPFIVSGNHTYAEANAAGYTITVLVTDNTSDTTQSTTTTAVVADASLTDGAAVNVLGSKNQPLVNVPVAIFVDNNPDATPSDIIASIDWGDATPQTNGIVTKIGSTTTGATIFQVSGSHVYTTSVGSPFTMTVNIADEDTFATNGGVPQVVLNPTATISPSSVQVTVLPIVGTAGVPTGAGTPGTPAGNELIATFTDTAETNLGALPGPLTATIDWGDGSPLDTTPTILPLGGGQFGVYDTHDYVNPGIFKVTVTVNDSDPAVGVGANIAIILPSTVITVTPAPAPGGVAGVLPPGVEGQPLATTPGLPPGALPAAVEVATFQVNAPGVSLANYSAQIDWGDGSPQSTGQILPDLVADAAFPGTSNFIVTGEHTYAEARIDPYLITVFITQNAPQGTLFFFNDTTTVHVNDSIVINDAPLSTGTALPIAAAENQNLNNILVATFVDANPLATSGDFYGTINWGDGSTPTLDPNISFQIIGANPAGPGVLVGVYGSHTYKTVGTFSTQISVTDEDLTDNTVSAAGTSNVVVSASPLVLAAAPVNGVEGNALPNAQTITAGSLPPYATIVATFSDGGGADPAAAYTATIDWGNGQITPGTIVPLGGPNFAILAPASPAIVYAEEGNYTIQVTLVDTNGGFSAYAASTATVTDAALSAAPPQPVIPAVTQGVPTGVIPLVSFSDANPLATIADYSVTIDWGDGSPQSAGQVVQQGAVGTPFNVTGNHTYANPSTGAGYLVTVYIKDDGGSSLVLTTTIPVAASTITGTATTVNAVEGQPVANAIVGYFTDSGLAGPISSYSASINWGDGSPGTTTPGQIVPVGGNEFEVVGNLPTGYPEEGHFNITVTISHNGTIVAAPIISTANVADAPLSSTAVPINPVEGAAFTGAVAHFTDLDPNGAPSDYTVVINWGDGVTSPPLSGAVTQPGGPNTPFTVTATHTYHEEGTYTTTVTITDAGGATTTVSSVALVADAPLAPVNPQPTVPATEGTLFTGPVATFSDANPFGSATDFTATIDWGDGTPNSVGSVVATSTPNVYQVIGTHDYINDNGAPLGGYTITTTIHDDGGSVLVVTNTATVTATTMTLTGQLNPASDSGKSNTDAITNVTDPNFFGTSLPGAVVNLYATPVGGGATIHIGSGVAGADGSWSITSSTLANGSYTITAQANDRNDPANFIVKQVLPNAAQGFLVIDTTGPRITAAAFDRFTDTATFTIQDFLPTGNLGGSGPLVQSLMDAANYGLNQIVKVHGKLSVKPNVVTGISVTPGVNGSNTENVTVTFNNGAYKVGGYFQLIARAASVVNTAGIQDLAGNALDGEFYGAGSASGNGIPGGDFVANFTIVHNFNSGPQTIVGIPHPNDPAGHFKTATKTKAVKHKK